MPRVLIVEDDAQVRRVLTGMLERQGCAVESLDNGADALTRCEQDPAPDLVLLDVMMPGATGFEICRAIKANPKTRLVPVVLVTGLGGSADRVAGIDAGADDFLTKPFDRVELSARVRSLLRLKAYTDELEHAESVLFALARSIEARDPYTAGHCERLSRYATALGTHLGLDEEDLTALWKAGIVHDLGKIGVPDAILLKPGPLTPEERRVIEHHPVTGDEICRPIRSFSRVRPIIRHHHERQDGSGYPDGLQGDEVPLTARVLQVVDVFDALTTTRPYREALSPKVALDTLEREVARGWWDGNIVRAFTDLVTSSTPVLAGERAA
jgi:putative two-component system response regulator